MRLPFHDRRSFILATGVTGLGLALGSGPALAAQGLPPTESMRGGSNNYRPNAPLVDRLGSGFVMSGTVRRAGDGAPLEGVRIQIWAATTLGGEREPRNHGSVLTRADGSFRLEMEQIVPNFGQPHAHLAYDDGAFETVFLRPVMPSASDTSLSADFVLQPV
ncbi:twin-arginine translocation pathway signal [Paracoccus sp. TK19116]|uniref:Twin-arginine translocation pathway signal n=1 Tax=Paracoccus albicereus TaxID=2922394 RepID=A0ABT1MSV1_9RHOB|nr:twin-arginine translocation pathway signal [Paracoccus albicereus]MCQ0971214.1 twin-arginine translocation pathway signal [Paracoccus albicereus]